MRIAPLILAVSALILAASLISACGSEDSAKPFPSTPIKAAGDSPITISINGSKVDMTVDIAKLGPPPKNYKARLYCGNLVGKKFKDTVQGETVWKKASSNSQVQLDGLVKADNNFCQLFLDNNIPIPIFLDKSLEQKTGKNFAPINSIRPDAQ